jgi:serine/threonine-protein kinase
MATSVSPEFLDLQALVAGRYSLERELGRGGMGIVLLARDVALDRLVAIKLLPPELAPQSELRNQFLREARTAAGLSHPHIVPIHAVEEHGEAVFFVMGFVDGETLRERVEQHGPLTPRATMKLLQEVAWALGYAHSRGVVHRDIKPENIMIERATGRSMVTDFGIASVAAIDGPGPSTRISGTAAERSLLPRHHRLLRADGPDSV